MLRGWIVLVCISLVSYWLLVGICGGNLCFFDFGLLLEGLWSAAKFDVLVRLGFGGLVEG